MECDICGKKAGTSPLLCITCARCAIEVPRIDFATTLIDRNKIEKLVKAAIEGSEDKSSQYASLTDSKGGLLVDRYECTQNINLQRVKNETAEVEERTQLIADQAALLREQMEATRKQFEAKRAQIAQRKSDLSSATYGVETRRANEAEKVQHYVKRLDHKLDKVNRDIVEWRLWSCNVAGKLAGLKITRDKTKDGEVKDVYNLGPGSHLRIYDLRDLNDAPSDSLSASLGLVASLLVRVACYLGVRLPAEITLPHDDYPQATIFQPASSYLGRKVPFPSGPHSSRNSPEASRILEAHTNLPKPRTLFIDRPLSHLAAQDTPAYLLFIEGVSLLAYNIAWLCRTQGLKDDFKTWEDVSPMGRNLYRLLMTQGNRPPALPENPLDKDGASQGNLKHATRQSLGFGEISHATSHAFLNTAENVKYLSGWKLSPTKITDDLRAFLLAEQQAQEWDVLSQKEWEDMEEIVAQEPGLVKEKRRNGETGTASLAGSTVTRAVNKASKQPSEYASDSPSRTDDRKKGTSGWTKLKSRTEEQ